eukprot:GAHX01003082.1.p1 GENE.GAHX01003082.1~~GAHX01003082.1.p1  ORF type:complete len:247 (-),score=59.19 GAHX01003082.1:52-792(-)
MLGKWKEHVDNKMKNVLKAMFDMIHPWHIKNKELTNNKLDNLSKDKVGVELTKEINGRITESENDKINELKEQLKEWINYFKTTKKALDLKFNQSNDPVDLLNDSNSLLEEYIFNIVGENNLEEIVTYYIKTIKGEQLEKTFEYWNKTFKDFIQMKHIIEEILENDTEHEHDNSRGEIENAFERWVHEEYKPTMDKNKTNNNGNYENVMEQKRNEGSILKQTAKISSRMINENPKTVKRQALEIDQ